MKSISIAPCPRLKKNQACKKKMSLPIVLIRKCISFLFLSAWLDEIFRPNSIQNSRGTMKKILKSTERRISKCVDYSNEVVAGARLIKTSIDGEYWTIDKIVR